MGDTYAKALVLQPSGPRHVTPSHPVHLPQSARQVLFLLCCDLNHTSPPLTACCSHRTHGDLVSGLYQQILLSLQKVLADPVRPLCSHYGAVVGLHALGWKVRTLAFLTEPLELWCVSRNSIRVSFIIKWYVLAAAGY